MADETIFELTGETAMTAASRLIVQKTGATTRATSATYALMGGLEVGSVITTDANVNGTAGKMERWDIDSLTAGRDFILPTAANIQTGERVGLYITSGSTTYDEEISIKSGAASDLINGVDHSTNPLTRLFQTGEYMIFRCIDGTTGDWIVEVDGRIPCHSRMYLHTDSGAILTDSTSVKVVFDSISFDRGDLIADTAGDPDNDRFDLRRAGRYWLFGQCHGKNLDTDVLLIPTIKDDAATPVEYARGIQMLSGNTSTAGCQVGTVIEISDSDVNTTAGRFALYFHQGGASGPEVLYGSSVVAGGKGAFNHFDCIELLGKFTT